MMQASKTGLRDGLSPRRQASSTAVTVGQNAVLIVAAQHGLAFDM
jgi:hypothetical protein